MKSEIFEFHMKLKHLFLLFLLTSCSNPKSVCFRETRKSDKFVYFGDSLATVERYFVFKDSIHEEYSEGKLYSKSKVLWDSCNAYKLIIQKVSYESTELMQPGDTLKVEILSEKNDTITCMASAFGFSAEIKFLRVDKHGK